MNENNQMTYAKAVKELRTIIILSQSELAELLGVSFQTVNRWERGAHMPTFKARRKLATYFKKYNIEINNKG